MIPPSRRRLPRPPLVPVCRAPVQRLPRPLFPDTLSRSGERPCPRCAPCLPRLLSPRVLSRAGPTLPAVPAKSPALQLPLAPQTDPESARPPTPPPSPPSRSTPPLRPAPHDPLPCAQPAAWPGCCPTSVSSRWTQAGPETAGVWTGSWPGDHFHAPGWTLPPASQQVP